MLIVPHALHCVDSCIFVCSSFDTVWHTVLVSVPAISRIFTVNLILPVTSRGETYIIPLCLFLLSHWLHTLSSGAGCSKLMTSLVNVSLKFQILLCQIHQYFLLKKCEKLLHALQKLLSFCQQKISVYLVIKS